MLSSLLFVYVFILCQVSFSVLLKLCWGPPHFKQLPFCFTSFILYSFLLFIMSSFSATLTKKKIVLTIYSERHRSVPKVHCVVFNLSCTWIKLAVVEPEMGPVYIVAGSVTYIDLVTRCVYFSSRCCWSIG